MSKPSPRNWNRSLRTVGVFALAYCVLYVGFLSLRGGPVERWVVHDAVVAPAAALARFAEPSSSARANGNRIESPAGSLIVQSGCEGVDALILLWAAIAAFPATVRMKCHGFLLGTLLVYGLNEMRLVVLLIASHRYKPLFEALHGYVAPTLMVLAISLYFLRWAWPLPATPHATA
jgi:exosortase family protein XrtM